MLILVPMNLQEGLRTGACPCRQQSWQAHRLMDLHAWQSSGHGIQQGPGRLPGQRVHIWPHRPQGKEEHQHLLIPACSSHVSSPVITESNGKEGVSAIWSVTSQLKTLTRASVHCCQRGGKQVSPTHCISERETEARSSPTEARLRRV